MVCTDWLNTQHPLVPYVARHEMSSLAKWSGGVRPGSRFTHLGERLKQGPYNHTSIGDGLNRRYTP